MICPPAVTSTDHLMLVCRGSVENWPINMSTQVIQLKNKSLLFAMATTSIHFHFLRKIRNIWQLQKTFVTVLVSKGLGWQAEICYILWFEWYYCTSIGHSPNGHTCTRGGYPSNYDQKEINRKSAMPSLTKVLYTTVTMANDNHYSTSTYSAVLFVPRHIHDYGTCPSDHLFH